MKTHSSELYAYRGQKVPRVNTKFADASSIRVCIVSVLAVLSSFLGHPAKFLDTVLGDPNEFIFGVSLDIFVIAEIGLSLSVTVTDCIFSFKLLKT